MGRRKLESDWIGVCGLPLAAVSLGKHSVSDP